MYDTCTAYTHACSSARSFPDWTAVVVFQPFHAWKIFSLQFQAVCPKNKGAALKGRRRYNRCLKRDLQWWFLFSACMCAIEENIGTAVAATDTTTLTATTGCSHLCQAI